MVILQITHVRVKKGFAQLSSGPIMQLALNNINETDRILTDDLKALLLRAKSILCRFEELQIALIEK